ncbi:Protein disulfide isomerase [Carpediemonas membranifera]|uniref:Protein disulfide isomerase n=1 Tax=Carpediemonas membranifera TaxID=201153 RepID=A0A8J6B8M8_9EUKA|nr:Protein disulfide isomerase [Carpediemonas membranifera]|eukprot:KAG9395459.1 Protein disulfide isomerase [Carpediemonas membranifera]
MKVTVAFVLFLVCLSMQAVVEVTDTNFAELCAEGPILVMFAASWCPHCKRTKPVFEAASDAFEGQPITFGAVNADFNPELIDTQEIMGFPTIKLFIPDAEEPIVFHDERTVENFLTFVDSNVQGLTIPKVAPTAIEPCPPCGPNIPVFDNLIRTLNWREDPDQVAHEMYMRVDEAGEDPEYGDYYFEMLRGVTAEGPEFIEKERRMLAEKLMVLSVF